jgi:septal ring factor EnvC (AmiA/AmiB activator)
VTAELHQLREQCDAFDALADALRTPDGWLSYRAMALRDQLHESARQDPAHPSSLERVCTALIDRDEALQRARADLENTRTLVANWEAEVASVRIDNRGLHSSLQEAQAQKRQAEERARALEQKAKEADDLRAALTPRSRRSPPLGASSCSSAPPVKELRDGFSRSRPPLPTLGRPWSGSALLARRRRCRWRTGTPSSPSSRAS